MDLGTYYLEFEMRIEANFPEMDSEIMVALRQKSEQYRMLLNEAAAILESNQALRRLLDQDEAVPLSEDDTQAFLQYQAFKTAYEDMERLELYLQGHRDCIAYLKESGAL